MDKLFTNLTATLVRIAVALEAIASSPAQATIIGSAPVEPAKVEPAAEAVKPVETVKVGAPAAAEPAKVEGPSIDVVRAALKEYRAIEGNAAMLEILQTHGGNQVLTDVDPAKFQAIMDALAAA